VHDVLNEAWAAGDFTTEGTEVHRGRGEEKPKTHPQKTRMGHPGKKLTVDSQQ